MSSSTTLPDNEELNQCDWNLSEVLPGSEKIVKHFKLHNKKWTIENYYSTDWLRIIVSHTHCKKPWDVQVGILDESGKAIAISKANNSSFTEFCVHNLIQRLKIDSAKLANKELRLFVQIDIKEDKKTKIKKASKRKLRPGYYESIRSSGPATQERQKAIHCYNCNLGIESAVSGTMKHHLKEAIPSGEAKRKYAESSLLKALHSRELGNKYAVSNTKFLCKKKLVKDISVEKFSEFYELSLLNNNPDVTYDITKFFKTKAKEILTSEIWQSYVKKNPGTSVRLLKKRLPTIPFSIVIIRCDRNIALD